MLPVRNPSRSSVTNRKPSSFRCAASGSRTSGDASRAISAGRHLDAGQFALVQPHAALAQAQPLQVRLGRLDAARSARGSRPRPAPAGSTGTATPACPTSAGPSAGPARARRPCVKPASCSGWRTPCSAGRLQPGAVVARVVEVGPATDDAHAQPRQQRLDARVQLVLAVVAAAAVVAEVIGVVELLGGDDLVADADQRRQPAGVVELGAGDAGAVGGDGDGPLAQGERERPWPRRSSRCRRRTRRRSRPGRAGSPAAGRAGGSGRRTVRRRERTSPGSSREGAKVHDTPRERVAQGRTPRPEGRG